MKEGFGVRRFREERIGFKMDKGDFGVKGGFGMGKKGDLGEKRDLA